MLLPAAEAVDGHPLIEEVVRVLTVTKFGLDMKDDGLARLTAALTLPNATLAGKLRDEPSWRQMSSSVAPAVDVDIARSGRAHHAFTALATIPNME